MKGACQLLLTRPLIKCFEAKVTLFLSRGKFLKSPFLFLNSVTKFGNIAKNGYFCSKIRVFIPKTESNTK